MTRELDLTLLRTFITVAKMGSFTEAGRLRCRTQSAISQQIKRLEEQIGHILIERTGSGLSLTPEGLLLLRHADRMLILNDTALQQMRGIAARETIRLGVPEEYASDKLNEVIKRFATEYPLSSIEIDIGLSGPLSTGFRQNRYDMVLSKCLAEAEAMHVVQRLDLVWVGGVRSSLTARQPLPLIVFSEGCLYRQVALSALATADLEWDILCTCSSWSGIRSALLAGIGISMVALNQVESGMRIIGEEEGLPRLPEIAVALFRRSLPISSAHERLAELLEESFQQKIPDFGYVPLPGAA